MEIEQKTETALRRRSRGKRGPFRVPKRMAVSVKVLWEQATEEEKTRSHRTCGAILEYWMGRATKQEVAERLGLPPIRIWQMSQQALSGMLAGLLVQPRMRGKTILSKDPQDDPKALRKKIKKLELELDVAQQLIEILRELPANRERRTILEKKPGKKKNEGEILLGGPSVRGGSLDSSGGSSERKPDPRGEEPRSE